MQSQGMSTEMLDGEVGRQPYCFEFFADKSRHLRDDDVTCDDCIIFRSKTLNCWELKPVLNNILCAVDNCHDCDYLKMWKKNGAQKT